MLAYKDNKLKGDKKINRFIVPLARPIVFMEILYYDLVRKFYIFFLVTKWLS